MFVIRFFSLIVRFPDKPLPEWPGEAQAMPIPQTLVDAAAAAEQVAHQMARGKAERQGFRQQPPPMKVIEIAHAYRTIRFNCIF